MPDPPGYCRPCRDAKPRGTLAEAVAARTPVIAPPAPVIAPPAPVIAPPAPVIAPPAPVITRPGETGADYTRNHTGAAGRCATCPVRDLPVCAGEVEPAECGPVATGRLRRRSVFHSSVRSGWPRKPPPVPAPPPPNRVVIRARLDNYTGYGQLAGALALALRAAGHPVAIRPVSTDGHRVPIEPAVLALVDAAAPEPWELLIHPPNAGDYTRPGPIPLARIRRAAIFTMWEASRLAASQVEQLNQAEVVIVPCRWCAAGFAASGVTAPIRVVPLGIDPAVFRPRPLPPANRFRFGCVARLAHGGERKNLDALAGAFLAAFPDKPGVRLRLKVWDDCRPDLPADPRIEVERGNLTGAEFADWLANCHVYASASRAEGFGLPILQAMALGRPAIIAPYSGVADYWDETCGWAVPYDEAPATGTYAAPGATWAVPRPRGLAAALKAAYLDWPGLLAKGANAAVRAAEYPWSRTGAGVVDVLREFGFLPSEAPP